MSLLGASTVDYLVERSLNPRVTRISANGMPVAELRGPGEANVFTLTASVSGDSIGDDHDAHRGVHWMLSPKVRGVMKPFSMTVKRIEHAPGSSDDTGAGRGPNSDGGAGGGRGGERREREAPDEDGFPIFTIEDGLFFYRSRFYIFNGRPEGRPLRELLVGGKKYICRLDQFSFSNLAELNREAWSNLGRLRGAPVGELDGLGASGHHVKLLPELQPIGLPLAAASFLLYSTV
jgi:hypothetical protein